MLDVSLKLVTLKKDVDIDKSFDDLKISYDHDRVVDFLKAFGFNSLAKRLVQQYQRPENKKHSRLAVGSLKELKNFFELNRIQKFSFFFSSYVNGNNVLAICCGFQTIYCVFSLQDEPDLFCQNMNLKEICTLMKPYLENPDIKKIEIRNELRYFKNVELKSYDDLSVMAYLLHGIIEDSVGDIFYDCISGL